MDATRRLQPNAPEVVYEQFDAEVVVVNLDSGYYYSLDETASLVWSGLVGGLTPDRIVQLMQQRFQGEGALIESSVQDFINRLIEEKLLVTADPPDGREDTGLSFPDQPTAFRTPSMDRFEDMQDMLLLDPIHEVDETGWPHAKPDTD